jgi:ABC-type uncharacterized transport system permease subunit
MEIVGLGKSVTTVSIAADLDQFVASAFAECQGVLAGFGGGIADQKRSIGRVLHQIVDFFAADILPVPLGITDETQARLASGCCCNRCTTSKVRLR